MEKVHSQKKNAVTVPLGVQQHVTGAVSSNGDICTFFTPKAFIIAR